jgi:hypothetical protein
VERCAETPSCNHHVCVGTPVRFLPHDNAPSVVPVAAHVPGVRHQSHWEDESGLSQWLLYTLRGQCGMAGVGERHKSGMNRDVRSGTACLVTPPLVAGGMAIQTAREGAPLLLSREVKDAAKGAAELSHHAAESMMPQACRGVNKPAGVAPHVLSPEPSESAPASNVQQMQDKARCQRIPVRTENRI